jgi:hypothetical protein
MPRRTLPPDPTRFQQSHKKNPTTKHTQVAMEDAFCRAAVRLPGDDRSRINCRSVVFDVQAACDSPPLLCVALWWSSEPVIPSTDGNKQGFADTTVYISSSADTLLASTSARKQLRFGSDGQAGSSWKRVSRCSAELQEEEKKRQTLLQQRQLKRERLLQQREERQHRIRAKQTPHPRGQTRMVVDTEPCPAVRMELST